jgi:hypothetical protein
MPEIPPPQYGVEILLADGVISSALPASYPGVEIAAYPPSGGGYDRVEVLSFTKQGPLTVVTDSSEFPIAGGTFMLSSIAAHVSVVPTGSPVILDVLKNDVSIFAVPGDRPTIAAGASDAVIGDFGSVMLVDGDYLEVIIAAVGSTTPGETLVASIRLSRIG